MNDNSPPDDLHGLHTVGEILEQMFPELKEIGDGKTNKKRT